MCKSPLYAIRRRYCDSNGELHFVNGDNKLMFVSSDEWFSRRYYDVKARRLRYATDYDEFLRVPCGQCIECRLRYSKEWAARIVCEKITARNCLFVTLTYDNDHIHLNSRGDLSTLVYDDLRDYIKRLRECIYRKCGERDLRYYAAGEYGDKSGRSHFHVCFFNLPDFIIQELSFYGKSPLGDLYFTSETLTDLWSRGLVVCGELSFKSAAYVARYVTKKLKGKAAKKYVECGISAEQSRMSLKPGIGKLYFDLHKDDIYENDELILPGVGKVMTSKYFDRCYALDEPEDLERIKGLRRYNAENLLQVKLSQTDLDEVSLMESELRSLEARAKKLFRPLD